MSKHHTEDYKFSAVKYYLDNDIDMRKTCDIFRCSYVATHSLVYIYAYISLLVDSFLKVVIYYLCIYRVICSFIYIFIRLFIG